MAKKTKQSKKLSDLIFHSEAKEIATGISIEKLSAMYFDVNALKVQPEPLYRMDTSGHRYYYRYEGEEPVFYTSVTTLIKNTLPTSPYLIKWMIDKGGDEGKNEAEERANYGTFLHMQCGTLLITGTYDLDKLKDNLTAFCTAEKIEAKKDWELDLKKDILAFAQFMIEYNVKPLAIEIILYHPTDGYAGALDIVVEMDWKKARIKAIIDIKSGKKGFYESHEIQLKAYAEMWKIHFPTLPVDKVFNWSPKSWLKSPTFNLKDQTESRSAYKLPYLVELAKIEDAKRENLTTIIKGNIDLTKGLADNVEEITFTELIKRNK
jgi:hypothetical protein